MLTRSSRRNSRHPPFADAGGWGLGRLTLEVDDFSGGFGEVWFWIFLECNVILYIIYDHIIHDNHLSAVLTLLL